VTTLNLPKDTVAVSIDTPKDQIMGYYAMTSIPNGYLEHRDVYRAWMRYELDPELIPHDARPIDGFKNACRSAETRRKDKTSAGVEVKVDAAHEDASTCIYQVTLMLRSREDKVVEHGRATMIHFDKDTNRISCKRVPSSEQKPAILRQIGQGATSYLEVVSEIEDSIRAHYDENFMKIRSHKMRTALANFMDKIGAVNVRRKGGAVWFVPGAEQEQLFNLGKALQEVYQEEADLHLIPCASDSYQRKIVERHFAFNTSRELDEIISEVRGRVVNGQGFRTDKFARLKLRQRDLMVSYHRYRELLNAELGVVADKLEALDKMLQRAEVLS
jgi:hypothetical protein